MITYSIINLGDDRWGYEKASERWLPVHTVETILVSVISMLADPNDEEVFHNSIKTKYWLKLYFINLGKNYF